MGLGLRRRWRQFRATRLERMGQQNNRYDEETVQVMERVLRPDSCAIDVGAHTGAILSHMVRIAPKGQHIAIEPLPHLAGALRQAFATVQVHELAVSDHAGTDSFVHVENEPAYSGLRQRIYDRPDPQLATIVVRVQRLDDLVGATRIAFIKLDIEGGEYHALRGAARCLKRDHPIIVFEAGAKSTGQYGITPEMFYGMLADEFEYQISTMRRWLGNRPAWSRDEWVTNWHRGPEYYFIAYPMAA